MGIQITGTGCCIPEKILTNSDFEKLVDTNDEWITARTGIRERHIADAATATSDLASGAALKALENAGRTPDELDLIIVSTLTPDYPCPNTASVVQKKINAPHCMCFDVEAACSGLLYAVDIARSMIIGGGHKKVLVIGADKLSSITDYTDRSTCILFGDAASALVIEENDRIDYDFMVGKEIAADGSMADVLRIPAGGSAMPVNADVLEQRMQYLHMGGQKTFQLAITCMTDACRKVLEKTHTLPCDIRWAVPHQANERIINAVASRLNMENNIYKNIARYGNTSSASIGICLDELNRNGEIQRGDLILTASFGAGLTWAAELLRW